MKLPFHQIVISLTFNPIKCHYIKFLFHQLSISSTCYCFAISSSCWFINLSQQKNCGLYYKHLMIVNDDSSVISKWSFKLIDNPRVIIYDRHRFIIQATDLLNLAIAYVISLYFTILQPFSQIHSPPPPPPHTLPTEINFVELTKCQVDPMSRRLPIFVFILTFLPFLQTRKNLRWNKGTILYNSSWHH